MKYIISLIGLLVLVGCDNGAKMLDCVDGCTAAQVGATGEAGLNGLNGHDGMDGATGPQGETGLPAPTPTPPSAIEEQVSALVEEENAYRLGLGQTMLSEGLSCNLYTFTSGDRIQSSIAGHNTLTPLVSVGSFLLTSVINQLDSSINDGMSVLPEPMRSIYKNLYMLRCQGYVVVTQTGYYNFELSSDDAGLLYIDGSKLIDNDNNHGMSMVAGSKYLRKGVHAFRLDYAQAGGGNQGLILKANGSLIDPLFYVH